MQLSITVRSINYGILICQKFTLNIFFLTHGVGYGGLCSACIYEPPWSPWSRSRGPARLCVCVVCAWGSRALTTSDPDCDRAFTGQLLCWQPAVVSPFVLPNKKKHARSYRVPAWKLPSNVSLPGALHNGLPWFDGHWGGRGANLVHGLVQL